LILVLLWVAQLVMFAALRILVGSHSPGFGPANMRDGKRHAGGVKDSGRPSWARVHCDPGEMI